MTIAPSHRKKHGNGANHDARPSSRCLPSTSSLQPGRSADWTRCWMSTPRPRAGQAAAASIPDLGLPTCASLFRPFKRRLGKGHPEVIETLKQSGTIGEDIEVLVALRNHPKQCCSVSGRFAKTRRPRSPRPEPSESQRAARPIVDLASDADKHEPEELRQRLLTPAARDAALPQCDVSMAEASRRASRLRSRAQATGAWAQPSPRVQHEGYLFVANEQTSMADDACRGHGEGLRTVSCRRRQWYGLARRCRRRRRSRRTSRSLRSRSAWP